MVVVGGKVKPNGGQAGVWVASITGTRTQSPWERGGAGEGWGKGGIRPAPGWRVLGEGSLAASAAWWRRLACSGHVRQPPQG